MTNSHSVMNILVFGIDYEILTGFSSEKILLCLANYLILCFFLIYNTAGIKTMLGYSLITPVTLS